VAPVSPLAAALGCKCPRCGRGALFKGFLTVADRCTACDLDLSEVDSGDGPAVFLIFILGFTVVPGLVVGLALLFLRTYNLGQQTPAETQKHCRYFSRFFHLIISFLFPR